MEELFSKIKSAKLEPGQVLSQDYEDYRALVTRLNKQEIRIEAWDIENGIRVFYATRNTKVGASVEEKIDWNYWTVKFNGEEWPEEKGLPAGKFQFDFSSKTLNIELDT